MWPKFRGGNCCPKSEAEAMLENRYGAANYQFLSTAPASDFGLQIPPPVSDHSFRIHLTYLSLFHGRGNSTLKGGNPKGWKSGERVEKRVEIHAKGWKSVRRIGWSGKMSPGPAQVFTYWREGFGEGWKSLEKGWKKGWKKGWNSTLKGWKKRVGIAPRKRIEK